MAKTLVLHKFYIKRPEKNQKRIDFDNFWIAKCFILIYSQKQTLFYMFEHVLLDNWGKICKNTGFSARFKTKSKDIVIL